MYDLKLDRFLVLNSLKSGLFMAFRICLALSGLKLSHKRASLSFIGFLPFTSIGGKNSSVIFFLYRLFMAVSYFRMLKPTPFITKL